jgi:hypothetical protein
MGRCWLVRDVTVEPRSVPAGEWNRSLRWCVS